MRNRGWVVTAAGTGINLALGVLYAWSVFKGAIQTELGLTDFQASLPYAVASGMFALMMVPAGLLVDRLGPRIAATLGGAFAGIGLVLCYFANSVAMLVLGFGLLTGAGIGLGYAAATPAAVKWFSPHEKGKIAGIVVSGFGLASAYISPLGQYLLGQFGFRLSFLFLGLAFFVLTIGLAQLVVNPPPGYVPPNAAPAAAKGTAASPARRDYTSTEMLRTPQFYLLWLMYAAGAMGGLMIIGHLATYAKSVGIEGGFLLVAVLAVFNALGRVLAGAVSDKLGPIRTMLVIFIIHAAALLLLPSLNTFALLAAGAGAVGFCYGAYLALFPAATYEFFGTKHSGINYGLVFTAWGLGGVFGAPLAGYIQDVTGSYTPAFQIAAGLLGVAALLSLLTRAPRPTQSARAPIGAATH
ncbi:MAG TPA: OFA family MFS transporter [Symbiobacteriaceae bacterium]